MILVPSATSCGCWWIEAVVYHRSGANFCGRCAENESRRHFLSNGPGDPAPCDYAITAIQNSSKPIFRYSASASAISCWPGERCEDCQNEIWSPRRQPSVKDVEKNVVMITAQNHGFAVMKQHYLQTCVSHINPCSTVLTGHSSYR